jgi:hypothetical protein
MVMRPNRYIWLGTNKPFDAFTFDFAARIPALVCSEIRARSSCATVPRTWRENMPCGVVVSMGSPSDRKMGVPSGQLLDDCQEMADRPSQAIKADDDKRVAGCDLAQQLYQRRSGTRCARAEFQHDHAAAGRT